MKNTYWNENGKYQKEYDKLYEKFVPSTGYTGNKYINLLIATSKRYYDLYNNGLGNEDTLYDYCIKKIEPILIELKCSDEIKYCFTKNRFSTEIYEEPIYIWDEDNDCETDEIDYYEEKEEEVIKDLTQQEYKYFELFVDSVIELCIEKLQ